MSNYTDGVIEIPTKGGAAVRATLTESGWECDNPDALEFLSRFYPYPNNPALEFSPLNPNPMLDLMKSVAGDTNGTITQRPKSTLPPGTVF